MRRLLAFSFLIVSAGSASAFQYPATALGEDAAAIHRAMPSVTRGVTGGVEVGRDLAVQLERQIGGPKSVPISARVRVPKASVSARAAALCAAFPPRCVGQLALGLAATWAFNEAADAILASENKYQTSTPGNCSFNNTSSGQFTGPNPASREGCFAALLAEAQRRGSLVAASQGGPWEVELIGPRYRLGGGAYDPLAVNTSYCQTYRHVRTTGANAGTRTTTHECGLAFRAAGTAQPGTREVTEDEILESFGTRSATWPDTTFAAVFADAVTKGATFPLTVTDFASVTSPGTEPEVQRVAVTTRADGATVTRTTTTQVQAESQGDTRGDAIVILRDVTTETEEAPEGTTVTETENPATAVPGQNLGTETPTPEPTGDQCGAPGQAACATQEVGTFDAPTFIIPGVPAAPTFSASLERLGQGLAAAPIASIAAAVAVPTGAACPVYSGTFEIVGTLTFDTHCVIAENIRPVLTGVCILIYGLWGIRRVMSA